MPVILLLLWNLIGSATAFSGIPDFLKLGPCATVRLQPNFEIHKYQGLWWEILAVPNKFEVSMSCTVQNSTLAGSSLKVYTIGLDNSENRVKQNSVLSPKIESGSLVDSADLIVEFSGVPTVPYQVLATDYRNYSCVYSCMDYMGFKAEFAWVFGRTPHLSPKVEEKCNAVFWDFKIDPTILKKTAQGKMCPYYHHLTDIIQSNENFIESIFSQKNIGDKSTEIVPTSAIHSSSINNLIPTNIYPITIKSQFTSTDSLGTITFSNFPIHTNKFPTDITITSVSPRIIPITTNVITTDMTSTLIPITTNIITADTTPTLIPFIINVISTDTTSTLIPITTKIITMDTTSTVIPITSKITMDTTSAVISITTKITMDTTSAVIPITTKITTDTTSTVILITTKTTTDTTSAVIPITTKITMETTSTLIPITTKITTDTTFPVIPITKKLTLLPQ